MSEVMGKTELEDMVEYNVLSQMVASRIAAKINNDSELEALVNKLVDNAINSAKTKLQFLK